MFSPTRAQLRDTARNWELALKQGDRVTGGLIVSIPRGIIPRHCNYTISFVAVANKPAGGEASAETFPVSGARGGGGPTTHQAR